jgi:hypothetical protein
MRFRLNVLAPRVTPRIVLCAFGTWLLVAGLALAACGNGRVVLPVTIDSAAAEGPRYPDDFQTHEDAVRSMASILVRDLGLPVPAEVTVFVYNSRDVFQQGLISDGRVSPVRAAELSDFAIGVGKRRQLLLHEEAGGQSRGREWLRLIAHELAHVAQIELAQGEGRADQWLAEGMAEWVAFTALQRLALDTLAGRRVTAANYARRHAAVTTARLDLQTLGTPRGFTARHLREGSLATYQLSFFMADYLIARHGFPRLVDYFRAFAAQQDRRGNFHTAFGQSLEEFEQEILAHLARATH